MRAILKFEQRKKGGEWFVVEDGCLVVKRTGCVSVFVNWDCSDEWPLGEVDLLTETSFEVDSNNYPDDRE